MFFSGNLYFFFSNCEILILIFDVNKSPISVTHQMTLYIYNTYDVHWKKNKEKFWKMTILWQFLDIHENSKIYSEF